MIMYKDGCYVTEIAATQFRIQTQIRSVAKLQTSFTLKIAEKSLLFNTLRTGAFKLFKCTFPGPKQFKSTFILCLFKYL